MAKIPLPRTSSRRSQWSARGMRGPLEERGSRVSSAGTAWNRARPAAPVRSRVSRLSRRQRNWKASLPSSSSGAATEDAAKVAAVGGLDSPPAGSFAATCMQGKRWVGPSAGSRSPRTPSIRLFFACTNQYKRRSRHINRGATLWIPRGLCKCNCDAAKAGWGNGVQKGGGACRGGEATIGTEVDGFAAAGMRRNGRECLLAFS